MTTGILAVAERYLTVEDVAERLQISDWTVRDWLKSGKLIGFQPGGRRAGWRVRESDLERFVAEAIALQATERGDEADS
jgi:excisionase family DNA binding protein